MLRPAACLSLLLLAACTQPINTNSSAFSGFGGFAATPIPGVRGERDARLDACREQATRAVQWRDRGQLMRTDETESGRGTTTVSPYSRVEAERGGAQMERDRLITECLRGAPPVPVPQPAGGATR